MKLLANLNRPKTRSDLECSSRVFNKQASMLEESQRHKAKRADNTLTLSLFDGTLARFVVY